MNSTDFSYLRSVKKFDPSVIKGANRMTDKPAIEKALRALYCWIKAEVEHFGATCPDDFIIEMVENALAAIEAEKPAEDALNLVYQWRLDYKCDPELESMSELSSRIQQFAESYHAEQCKACKAITVTDNRVCRTCGNYTTCDTPFYKCVGKYWQPLLKATK